MKPNTVLVYNSNGNEFRGFIAYQYTINPSILRLRCKDNVEARISNDDCEFNFSHYLWIYSHAILARI